MRTPTRVFAAAAGAAVLLLGAACTSDDDTASETTGAEATTDAMTTDPTTATGTADATAAGPVGPGCAEYAQMVPDGPGSIDGMAQEPVAVAASNNPMLTQLTAAVSGQLNPEVNLVDTLNSGEFTVFAPVDSAFAQIDPATLDVLSTDAAMLTDILTYHVVPGQVAPDEIVGDHATVQGGMVTVSGTPQSLMVNEAGVVCGGVETANATVYLVDAVLMPPQQ